MLPAVAALLGACVWFLARAHWYSSWTDDDAFISFRYARNLATGLGLVYNVGERVEGYTNFLWTLVLAVSYRFDADLPRVARWLGVGLALATPALLLLGSRGLAALQPPATLPAAARFLVAALAPLVLCTSDTWAAWAVGGLENVGSAFLVTAALLAWWRGVETAVPPRPPTAFSIGALLLALAVLNHPANLLFVVPIAAQVAWACRAGRLDHRAWFLPLCLFVALVGIWVIWRLAYYGDWLPNTFHAKVGLTRFVLMRGLDYLAVAARALPAAMAAVVALVVLLVRQRQPAHPGWLLLTAIVLNTVYVVAIGGEEFPALRAFVVVLPMLALVFQMLASALCRRLESAPSRWRQPAAVAMVVVCTSAHAAGLYASERTRVLDQAVRLGRTALSRTAAERLQAVLPANTLFAHSGAGLIAYYTNFRWIDTLGLTDRHIARTQVQDMGKGAAGHEKGDGAYVWSRQPDYVMFPGYPISDAMPSTKTDRELFAIPAFRTTYRSVRLPFTFQGPADDVPRQHVLFLWERIEEPRRP